MQASKAPSLRQSLVPSLRSAHRQKVYVPGVHAEVPLLEMGGGSEPVFPLDPELPVLLLF